MMADGRYYMGGDEEGEASEANAKENQFGG